MSDMKLQKFINFLASCVLLVPYVNLHLDEHLTLQIEEESVESVESSQRKKHTRVDILVHIYTFLNIKTTPFHSNKTTPFLVESVE